MDKKGHKPHTLEYLHIKSNNCIIHYTCNAPSKEVLDRNGIEYVGEIFRCANQREVLKIPLSVYKKCGFTELNDKNILILNLETLLKRL